MTLVTEGDLPRPGDLLKNGSADSTILWLLFLDWVSPITRER